MLCSSNCCQALLGVQLVLVGQHGAEALVRQKEGGPLDGQTGEEAVVPPWKGPDGQLARNPGVCL